MTHHPQTPIATLLVAPVDARQVATIWQAIEERRGRRGAARARLAFGVVALASVVAGVTWWSTRATEQPLTDEAPVAGLVTPTPIEVAERSAPQQVVLPDGAQVVLQPGTRLAPRRATAKRREWALERGRAHFEVPPQHGRTFAVDAGEVTVEVVGTAFSVERDAQGVHVMVERGRVRVRTPDAPDGTLLDAGDALRWSPPPRSPPGTATTADPLPEASSEQPTARSATQPDVEPWRVAMNAGDLRGAFALLGPEGHARAVRAATDAATLLALADMARIAGKPAAAARALEQLVDRHPGHSQAALSALMLGRIELDDLDHPARAVDALQHALDLGLPLALQEDALARLVEAAVGADDLATARRAAEEHRRRFPNGRWRRRVDSFVEPR